MPTDAKRDAVRELAELLRRSSAIAVLFRRLKNSSTRSRASADAAYSPTGPVACDSLGPGLSVGQSGYTLPVENATIRAFGKRVATTPGRYALTAQVRSDSPVVPNF